MSSFVVMLSYLVSYHAVILNTSGRFACVQVLKLSFFKRNEIINCVVFVL